jgi:hypothetical protein
MCKAARKGAVQSSHVPSTEPLTCPVAVPPFAAAPTGASQAAAPAFLSHSPGTDFWRPQSSGVPRDAPPHLVHEALQPRLVLRCHPALALAPAPHLRRRTGALRVSGLRARRRLGAGSHCPFPPSQRHAPPCPRARTCCWTHLAPQRLRLLHPRLCDSLIAASRRRGLAVPGTRALLRPDVAARRARRLLAQRHGERGRRRERCIVLFPGHPRGPLGRGRALLRCALLGSWRLCTGRGGSIFLVCARGRHAGAPGSAYEPRGAWRAGGAGEWTHIARSRRSTRPAAHMFCKVGQAGPSVPLPAAHRSGVSPLGEGGWA